MSTTRIASAQTRYGSPELRLERLIQASGGDPEHAEGVRRMIPPPPPDDLGVMFELGGGDRPSSPRLACGLALLFVVVGWSLVFGFAIGVYLALRWLA